MLLGAISKHVFLIQKLLYLGSDLYLQRSTPQLGFVARIKEATIVLQQILLFACTMHISASVLSTHKKVEPTKTFGPQKSIVGIYLFNDWIGLFQVGMLLVVWVNCKGLEYVLNLSEQKIWNMPGIGLNKSETHIWYICLNRSAYLILVTTTTTGGSVPFSSRRTFFHRERKMDCF